MEKSKYNYENLVVWQKSIDLAEKVYRFTGLFPREEIYGLTSQLRRAASSVPLNIAEGQARGGKKEFKHFLLIARGSIYELLTGLLLSKKLGYIVEQNYEELRNEIEIITKMLSGLLNSLNSGTHNSQLLTHN
jgi:four helix bundle protein